MANLGFELLVIKNVFDGRKFGNQLDFTKLVSTTGLFLGIIRCYGYNYDIHLPNDELWQETVRDLRVPEKIAGRFTLENGLLVIGVLNQTRSFKKWWKVRTVSILELSGGDFVSESKDLAIGEGADLFVDRRGKLALAVYNVATAYRMRKTKLFREGDFEGFPSLLEQAWNEQVMWQDQAKNC